MVYIPFISSQFEKRKGGGGGGRGGGGGGSKGSSSSSSSSSGGKSGGSSGSSGPKSTSSFKPTIAGSTKSTSLYGNGGGKPITIPAGQQFAGRQAGGATRSQVYGTPYYGSGYPLYVGSGPHYGVAGRGFPFFFWPIVWGTTAGFGAAYLWASIAEYGPPGSGSRPGGSEVMLTIQSPTKNQTYHLIADSDTAKAMIPPLESSCPTIGNKPLAVAPFDGSNGQPKPEQAIQYYRSSSVALTLDGYNNTVVFTDDENTSKPADPLPSGVDLSFLSCINNTIGAAVPLVDASVAVQTHAFWMLCVALLVGLRNAL